MPELVEVEIHRRKLDGWTGQRVIAGLRVLDPRRFEGDPAALADAAIRAWWRRGKYLIAQTDAGVALISHLGMTGRWVADPEPDRRGLRLLLDLDARPGPRSVGLVDARGLGRTWILAESDILEWPRLAGLGPDALEPTLDVGTLRERVLARRGPIKRALLDQKVVSGLGNIAVSEACWRAGVHPHADAASLSDAEWIALHDGIAEHLSWLFGVEVEADELIYVSERGAENPFRVYGRAGEPCPRCETAIERSVLHKRSSFTCPRCQSPAQTSLGAPGVPSLPAVP